jgi:hypothetical protein
MVRDTTATQEPVVPDTKTIGPNQIVETDVETPEVRMLKLQEERNDTVIEKQGNLPKVVTEEHVQDTTVTQEPVVLGTR